MSIIKTIKAAEWEITNKQADVPTEIVGTTYSWYSIIVGILFILSLLVLVLNIANYLKAKDEQKKKRAKKNIWRFFIIFITTFTIIIFWLFTPSFWVPA